MQLNKSAATMGETVGLGAGSGAAVGVLSALLDENPSARKVLRNALLGGAGGAAIGAGAKAMKGSEAPPPAAGPSGPDPDKMNLALAALTGVLPGVGPTVHGAVSQGVGQGVASGAASVAGPLAIGLPALLKARATGGQVSPLTHRAALLSSILGATGAAFAGNRLRADQVKEAAEIVRKTKMVEEHHDHCPHCDHEFTEKGYPRPANLPDDEAKRDEVLASGDYDEVCPACGGIVDQKEMTDEEIDSQLGYFFSGDEEGAEKMRQQYRDRREKQRQRRAEREKSAAMAPQDLRYWEEVNEAVRKKIAKMSPEKQAAASVGSVDVTGACGHSIRKGTNGVTVEIGKKCLICLKAGGLGKSASLRGAVLGGMVKSAKEAPGIRQARNSTHTHPTPAQASAGNYAKGEFSFKGLTIKIENPKGTERRGYDKTGAIIWRRSMHADYGYIKNTHAVDGDAIDVFVGPDHDSDLIVAVDQYRGDVFDETKFIVGVTTQEHGEKLYLKHYPRGWKLGPVSTTTVPQFKAWIKTGQTTKPFKGQMVKAANALSSMIRSGKLSREAMVRAGAAPGHI